MWKRFNYDITKVNGGMQYNIAYSKFEHDFCGHLTGDLIPFKYQRVLHFTWNYKRLEIRINSGKRKRMKCGQVFHSVYGNKFIFLEEYNENRDFDFICKNEDGELRNLLWGDVGEITDEFVKIERSG